MIENIKAKLWAFLEAKAVSLAFICDKEGRILWCRGRNIHGSTLANAKGFSRSCLEQAMREGSGVAHDDEVISANGNQLPTSAQILYIKSIMVLPLACDLFLYVDSGSKDSFSVADREVFKVIGELLSEGMERIHHNTGPGSGFCGRSAAAASVREQVAKFALFDYPVLLSGETGSGKTHVAEMIHHFSGRKGAYATIHAPSIPVNLLESELFGHRRGSFTDAKEDKKGLVEMVEGGTLFLDEIAELNDAAQARLLQFIDTRRYRVLGEHRERTANVRLVTATHRDLSEWMNQGRFRQDLFFRLDVLRLTIPSLRDRPEDIEDIIAEHKAFLMGKILGPEALGVLQRHPWPGNVRDLIHVLQRVGVQLSGPIIGREIETLLRSDGNIRTAAGPTDNEPWPNVRQRVGNGESFWDTAWTLFMSRDVNRREIRQYLSEELAACQGSLRQLCARLHVDDYPRFISALHKSDIHPSR